MSQEKIGKFIRKLRMEKEMTQQELAEKIGVTDRAISKWENGRGVPDVTLLIPLSTELDVSLLELLTGEKGIDEGNAVIKIIKDTDKKTKFWKYLTLGISNIVLILMSIVLIFGYAIPTIYENCNNKGINKILSASMEPTLEVGKGIVYDKVNINDVKKDDIVVFNYTDENGAFLASEEGLVKVIHRVIDVKKDENGNVNLVTKGDNNTVEDALNVTSHNFVGVYNRQTSDLTALFMNSIIHKYPIIFLILIFHVVGILIFDIVQLKKYFFE